MKEIRFLFCVLTLVFICGSLFPVDYYILTNMEAKAYVKPDLNSGKVDYSFENGELLSVYKKTNNGNAEWYFVKMVGDKDGWLLKSNSYDVHELADSKYYSEILNREVLNTSKDINIEYKIVDIKFLNFSKYGYYGMQYFDKEENAWSDRSFLYLLTNDMLVRSLAIGGIDRNYYFLSNYIVSFSKIGVSVFDTQLFEEDFESGKNPTGKLYKKVFTKMLIPRSQKKTYDSYAEFDETNRIMTEYLREDPQKPFKVMKYLFEDGKFILLTNTASAQPGQTFTLTGDNVNVRAEAATNGAVLVKLSKGAKVTLLKRSEMGLTVGDKKGFWAYIDTGITNKDGEVIKGWVFDYYLKEEK